MLKHIIDIGWTSVCPSVRLSVTRWHGIKTAERLVMISSPHDSPFILVLCIPRSSRNSDGVKISPWLLWKANRNSYAIYQNLWCHFQWPWMNPNPVFKIRIFFDAEYLQNDCSYGHSYYGRRIGNHTQAFEWHQFQWPWETSKPVFKVTILFNVK